MFKDLSFAKAALARHELAKVPDDYIWALGGRVGSCEKRLKMIADVRTSGKMMLGWIDDLERSIEKDASIFNLVESSDVR